MRNGGWTDEMNESATRIQAQYRARQSRVYFNNIVKANRIMKSTEERYLNEPNNRVVRYNYALYQLAILRNNELSGLMWNQLYDKMVKVIVTLHITPISFLSLSLISI